MYAVIEIELLTMTFHLSIEGAGPMAAPPTIEEMDAALEQALVDEGCIYDADSFPANEPTVTDLDPFVWIYHEPNDATAGGLFDKRTGALVLSIAGDWMGQDRLCTPAGPDELLVPELAPVRTPPACEPLPANVCGSTCDCESMMSGVNSWGGIWAECEGGCWTSRTLDDVQALVASTGAAESMTSCGGYRMFVVPLSTPGGAYCGDTVQNRVAVAIAGRWDVYLAP